MYICDALDSLNRENVRVNLLTGYKPATITEKAETPLYFQMTEPFYTMPKYEVTTAGNLNATFGMVGTVTDTEHDRSFDAVSFKSVSFVKNGKLFKDKLYINEEDVSKVRAMGIVVIDNYIPMDQFDIANKNSTVDGAAIAEFAVSEWVRKCLLGKATKKAAQVLDEDSQWLKDNGFANGVYNAPRKSSWTVVENDGTTVSIKIEKCSGKVDLAKLDEKLEAGKKLTFSENAINVIRTALGDEELEDKTKDLNQAIYEVLAAKESIEESYTVEMYGIEFNVNIVIK